MSGVRDSEEIIKVYVETNMTVIRLSGSDIDSYTIFINTTFKMVRLCRLMIVDLAKDLILMVRLNETIDQMAMANSVYWHCHVLRREDGHVLRRVLDFEVEGQRKKGRSKMTWQKQVEEESMKVCLRRKDALCRSKWSVSVNKVAAGLR